MSDHEARIEPEKQLVGDYLKCAECGRHVWHRPKPQKGWVHVDFERIDAYRRAVIARSVKQIELERLIDEERRALNRLEREES
jgi:hypothetical protein